MTCRRLETAGASGTPGKIGLARAHSNGDTGGTRKKRGYLELLRAFSQGLSTGDAGWTLPFQDFRVIG